MLKMTTLKEVWISPYTDQFWHISPLPNRCRNKTAAGSRQKRSAIAPVQKGLSRAIVQALQ